VSRDDYIVKRIEMIQYELEQLKKLFVKREPKSLRGIWKGANITDEEIEEAKRSLSPEMDRYVSGR
jgi:hypothetical protein